MAGREFRNVVYADALAAGLPTAWPGADRTASPVPVILGDYWSDEQCLAVGSQVLGPGAGQGAGLHQSAGDSARAGCLFQPWP